MLRARQEREVAVEESNNHWMSVVQKQSEATAKAAMEAEVVASERLSAEVRKVGIVEESSARVLTESSAKLREIQEALAQNHKEELDVASHRRQELAC